MVGDDDVGLRRGARRMFDEAFAEMRATRIDALAAPVGERGGAVAAEERGEPAGQVAADHVAVAAVGGPARDELREDRGAARKAALQRHLEVAQAEIIFAPLAPDDLLAVRRGVGVEPPGLARWPALAGLGAGREAGRAR